MKRALWLLTGLLTAGAAPGRAATWEPTQVQLPGPTEVFTLSPHGRSAAVGPDGAVHVTLQGVPEEGTSLVYTMHRAPTGGWSDPELVSTGTQARSSSLAVGPQNDLHVVWVQSEASQGEIRYRHRTATGAWGPVEVISLPMGLCTTPVIAADSFGRPHAVWVQSIEGRPRLLYSLRTDGWSEPLQIGPNTTEPGEPTLVADGLGNIHVAWADRVGDPNGGGAYNYEIFYARLRPEPGAAFEVSRLTQDLAVSREPFLEATGDGTVHLVWLDNRADPSGGTFEVYYKRRLPGLSWGKDKRFTYDKVAHGRVVLAAGADNTVNVAWEDYRHGNPEIYYRQITWEYGWDPSPTRLTSDVSPSQRPSLVTLPDGGMVLLWTDAIDTRTVRVFAKDGDVRLTPGGN